MNEAGSTWKRIQELVRPVLLQDWDPCGVDGIPEAQDEYDGYIGHIYVLLQSSASDLEIADHLAKIETEQMGMLPIDRERHIRVIRRLRALDLPRFRYPTD